MLQFFGAESGAKVKQKNQTTKFLANFFQTFFQEPPRQPVKQPVSLIAGAKIPLISYSPNFLLTFLQKKSKLANPVPL